MACKYCGTNWKKDVTIQELKEEIKLRRVRANEACKEYFARVYPTHNRDEWFTLANFVVAIIGGGLCATSHVGSYIHSYTGIPAVQFLLPTFVLFLLCTPSFYLIRKEKRIHADFRKEYPEHAEALQGD